MGSAEFSRLRFLLTLTVSNKGKLCILSLPFIHSFNSPIQREKERENTSGDTPIGHCHAPRVSLIDEIGKRRCYSLWNLFPRMDRTWCILWRVSLVAFSCLSRARACNLTSMSAEQHTSPPLLTLPHTLSSFAV